MLNRINQTLTKDNPSPEKRKHTANKHKVPDDNERIQHNNVERQQIHPKQPNKSLIHSQENTRLHSQHKTANGIKKL